MWPPQERGGQVNRWRAAAVATVVSALGAALIWTAGDAGLSERMGPAALPGTLPARPNLIVITLDTMRADRLGHHGYFRDTSPRLDALATESIVFDQFLVPMATTLPTHTSLFTGVHPVEHGIRANVSFSGERFVPADDLLPLAVWARDNNYTTAAFVSSGPLKPYSGILSGFDHQDYPPGHDRRAKNTTEAVLQWLTTAPAEPFLLWVHYYDPHYPYYGKHGDKHDFQETEAARSWLREREIGARNEEAFAKNLERNARYDSEVHYMDHHVGRLLDRLGEELLDRSVLVVAGDHGEGVGQHNHIEHGLVWGNELRAPLMIRAPGLVPGRRVDPVSAHDVLPTLLGLTDLSERAGILSQVSGRDLLAKEVRPEPVVSVTSDRRAGMGTSRTYALSTPGWRLVWKDPGEAKDDEGKTRLYDLEADPHELHSVHKDHGGRVKRLRRQLKERLETMRIRAAELGSGTLAPVDATTLEELRELGYLDDQVEDEAAPVGE